MKLVVTYTFALFALIFSLTAHAVPCEILKKSDLTVEVFNEMVVAKCVTKEVVDTIGWNKIAEAEEKFLIYLGRDVFPRADHIYKEQSEQIGYAVGIYQAFSKAACEKKLKNTTEQVQSRLCGHLPDVNNAFDTITGKKHEAPEMPIEDAKDQACQLRGELSSVKQVVEQDRKEESSAPADHFAQNSQTAYALSNQISKLEKFYFSKTKKNVTCE